jgi:heat shock protein HslJ
MTSEPISLDGLEWHLVAWAGPDRQHVDVPAGILATAVFADDVVTGSTGCNRYHAPYELEGSALRVGPAAMTMMACAPERTEVERAFTGALASVRAWALEGDELRLLDADGRVALRFRAAVAPAFVGTAWVATGINNGRGGVASPVEGTEVTATFRDDGRVTGSGGCNRYFGPYERAGAAIRIGPLAGTRMACPEPPGAAEQEAAFLAAMERATTWSIREDRLELRAADGALQVGFRTGDGS